MQIQDFIRLYNLRVVHNIIYDVEINRIDIAISMRLDYYLTLFDLCAFCTVHFSYIVIQSTVS